MEFRLLGSVEVWVGDRPVPIEGRKPLAALAALLVEDNRVVPVHRLVDAVWGDAPPASAKAVIQTYVSGLRRCLQKSGVGQVIVSHPNGYAIRVPAETVDRNVFERLAAEGQAAAAGGRHADAVAAFRSALSLWRGVALDGVDGVLRVEGARLDELRLTVLEQRIAAELALGRHEQLVGELVALVGSHPTRERLRADLMIALYRLGRQVEALEVYRQGRELLVAELGIEPGPELRDVHEAILRSDRAMLGQATSQKAPAQLPAAPPDFTGRDDEIAVLTGWLSSSPAASACVIAGPGGTGKSAFATHVAHRAADDFPDGQLYVELQGTADVPAEPHEVLGRVLRSLGEEPPASPAERVALYRTATARRKMLVVLDDAADEHQVRPLLPGGAGSLVVVTSRNRLAGLVGRFFVDLDVLRHDEAVELLARVAGRDRVTAEPDAAALIVAHCGLLPLAIRIAGAKLANHRRWSLRVLAERLADERRRLDELAVGDQAVRASIRLSYRGLDEESRRTLHRLGWLGLPDFSAWVAAALTELGQREAEQVLDRLVDAQLVEVDGVDAAGQPRYRMHDLVQLYAKENAEAVESTGALATATTRVLGGWLALLVEISSATPSGAVSPRTAYPGAAAVDPAVTAAVLADPRAWFEAEQNAMVAGVEVAAAMDLDEIAVELASALCGSVFVVDNLFDAWIRTHDAALAVARRQGNVLGEATLLAELGQLRSEQDRHAEAREYLCEALSMFRAAGEERGEAVALTGLGEACREQGHLREALYFFGGAEQLWQTLDDHVAVARVKRVTGMVALEIGDYRAAWDQFSAALWLYRKIANRRGEALTLRSIALYHRARDELDSSDVAATQALELFRAVGDRLTESYGARTWAKTRLRMGRTGEARQPLTEALDTARAMGDRWGEAMCLRVLGELDLAEGRLRAAQGHLAESLRIWAVLDLSLWRARTLRDVALLHEGLGEPERAEEVRAEAMEIFRSYGSREYREG